VTTWSADGRFPESVKNPLNQTTLRTFDARFGLPATETDPNGLQTSFIYDGFGRQTRETRPDGTRTDWAWADCGTNCGQFVTASQKDTAASEIRADTVNLDNFDRPYLTRTQLLGGGYSRVERQYDDLGRLALESAPCTEGACPSPLYWTTLSYDLIGRPTQVSRPFTNLTTQTTQIAYAGLRTSAGNSSEFQYGPDGQRWYHKYNDASTIYTHVNLGGIFEIVTRGAVDDFRHTIHANGVPIALYSRKSTGTNTLRYLLRDHLGSIDVIATSTGAEELRTSFYGFGGRRSGLTWSGAAPSGDVTALREITRRGFTDHEHLDQFNPDLIHMNGRVYDQRLTRFVSADPFIDGIGNTQGWNRYSYVGNNPLSYVDPSGYVPIPSADGPPEGSPDGGLFNNCFGSPGLRVCVSGSGHIDNARYSDFYGPLHRPHELTEAQRVGLARGRAYSRSGTANYMPNQAPAQTEVDFGANSTVDGLGQGFLNAVPGAYYAGQSQLAWQQGQYAMSVALYGGALADAAIGVLTLGQGSLATGAVRSTTIAARATVQTERLLANQVLHDHHLLPQQFRRFFSSRGINIDEHAVTLSESVHLRGVHGSGIGNMPGRWNQQWAQWIEANPNATTRDIYQQLGRMMDDFGLGGSRIHPYGQ